MDLQKMLEESGFPTRSYSGRGMCGRMCMGVVTDEPMELFATLVEVCESVEEYDTVVQAMRNVRQDSMGLSIILYWPRIPYSEAHKNPDVEECENCGHSWEAKVGYKLCTKCGEER